MKEELSDRKLCYSQRSREFHKKLMRNYTEESTEWPNLFSFSGAFHVTICKYKNDRDMGGLINEDSFKISGDYMEILIQEPKMKSI